MHRGIRGGGGVCCDAALGPDDKRLPIFGQSPFAKIVAVKMCYVEAREREREREHATSQGVVGYRDM